MMDVMVIVPSISMDPPDNKNKCLLFRILFVSVCSEESPGLWLWTSMILWPAITNGVELMLWPSNSP